jgi:hypothetical protein
MVVVVLVFGCVVDDGLWCEGGLTVDRLKDVVVNKRRA